MKRWSRTVHGVSALSYRISYHAARRGSTILCQYNTNSHATGRTMQHVSTKQAITLRVGR
eukprot:3231762-Rhodomonas_salina.1